MKIGDRVGFKKYTEGKGTIVKVQKAEDSWPRITRYAVQAAHKSAVLDRELNCMVVWVEAGHIWAAD